MTSPFDTSRLVVVIVLGVAIILVLIIVAREVYRAAHPRTKAVRKRKRRTF